VLRGFGEGNLPQRGWPEAVERLARQGLIIAVASQCQQGRVLPGRYEGSAQARDSGAIFPGDMTLEALTTKLMWLLGQGLDRDEVAARLLVPLAGELGA
jgi:L-asparaginase